MIIKPTVGRVVWFYPSAHPAGEQPLAAIVAHVWSDTCVNLAIFDANGVPFPKPPTSIQLIQEGDGIPTHDYCTWMPYQKSVASGQTAPAVHA